jgi:hypothetical protein
MAKDKWKQRNPVAKNLHFNKPKIIPNKRRKVKEKLQEEWHKEHEGEITCD